MSCVPGQDHENPDAEHALFEGVSQCPRCGCDTPFDNCMDCGFILVYLPPECCLAREA